MEPLAGKANVLADALLTLRLQRRSYGLSQPANMRASPGDRSASPCHSQV